MVTTVSTADAERIESADKEKLPRVRPGTASPYELASFLLGLPGAVLCSALTLVLAMYGMQGHALLAWSGIIGLLGTYLGVMTVLWLATASSQD